VHQPSPEDEPLSRRLRLPDHDGPGGAQRAIRPPPHQENIDDHYVARPPPMTARTAGSGCGASRHRYRKDENAEADSPAAAPKSITRTPSFQAFDELRNAG